MKVLFGETPKPTPETGVLPRLHDLPPGKATKNWFSRPINSMFRDGLG
jgi:hypothetical protein